MPDTVAADSPGGFDVNKLSIVVPAKSPRLRSSESDPSTPSIFRPDVSPVSASEPVSPSHALEQALKHQPISPSPSHEPHTPTPRGHHAHSVSSPAFLNHHHSSSFPTHATSSPAITTSATTTTTTTNGTTTTTTTTASTTTVPASPHPEHEDKVVLDLPMKLCLVILKRTAADMKLRYSEYLRTKESRHEAQPLTFQQYMFLLHHPHTARLPIQEDRPRLLYDA